VAAKRASAWDEVYAIVRRIPRGRVMSYGQIAGLLRHPLSARAVGWAMNQCPDEVPWHRVVNAAGGISTAHLHEPPDLQKRLLESEGVPFGRDGTLPMASRRWEPTVPRGTGRRTKKK